MKKVSAALVVLAITASIVVGGIAINISAETPIEIPTSTPTPTSTPIESVDVWFPSTPITGFP